MCKLPFRVHACWLAALLMTLAMAMPTTAQFSEAAHQQFLFAYRLMQRKEYPAAAKAFDAYLGKFPKDEKQYDAKYYRGYLAYQSGDSIAAAKFLADEGKTKLVPDYAVHLLRGQVHRNLKHHEQAIASLEKVRLDGLQPIVQATVLHLKGAAYFDLKNYAAAAENLDAAAKLNTPLRARALLDLGRVQVVLKKSTDALATYSACLELKDAATAPEAAATAGQIAYDAGQYDDAIKFYRMVITQYQTSPFFSQAATGVLWANLSNKHNQKAVDAYDQFSKVLTGNDKITATYIAGAARQGLGQHAQAVELFQSIAAAAKGMPLEDRLLSRLARSLFKLEKFQELSQVIVQLHTDHPDSPYIAETAFLRATSLAKMGEYSEAAARLTEIVTKGASHPYYAKALLQRAKVRESAKLLEPAASDYEQYLKATAKNPTPDYAQAALRLTDLNFQLSKFKEAETSAKQLLAQPNLDRVLEQEGMYRLAEAQRKSKQYEQAFMAYEALLKKHPQNKHAYHAQCYRGLLLMAMNRPDKAVPDLLLAAGSGVLEDALTAKAWRMAALRLRQTHDDKRAADALNELEKVIGRGELTLEEQLWLGRYYVETEEWKRGLVYLGPVLKHKDLKGDLKGEAFLLTATSLRELKEYAASANAYRQVIAISKGAAYVARLELARTLAKAGKFEEAIDEYSGLYSAKATPIAAEAIHDSATLYRQMARKHTLASEPDAAKDAYEKAYNLLNRLVVLFSYTQLSPLPQQAHVELSEVSDLTAQPEEAGKWLRELASKYKEDNYGEYGKAMLAARQKKNSDAVFLLKKLRDKDIDMFLMTRITAQLKTLEGTP